jgi:carboxymethylenebutenolidase
VCIRGDRLYHEHIWWEHASALKQCGALPSHVPLDASERPDMGKMMRLPIAGAEGAEKLLSENRPSNEMLEPAWKEDARLTDVR